MDYAAGRSLHHDDVVRTRSSQLINAGKMSIESIRTPSDIVCGTSSDTSRSVSDSGSVG